MEIISKYLRHNSKRTLVGEGIYTFVADTSVYLKMVESRNELIKGFGLYCLSYLTDFKSWRGQLEQDKVRKYIAGITPFTPQFEKDYHPNYWVQRISSNLNNESSQEMNREPKQDDTLLPREVRHYPLSQFTEGTFSQVLIGMRQLKLTNSNIIWCLLT